MPVATMPSPEQGCSHEGRAQCILRDRPVRRAGACGRLQQMLLSAHVLLLSANPLLLRRLLLQTVALHLLLVQILLPRLLLQAASLPLLLVPLLLPRLLLQTNALRVLPQTMLRWLRSHAAFVL